MDGGCETMLCDLSRPEGAFMLEIALDEGTCACFEGAAILLGRGSGAGLSSWFVLTGRALDVDFGMAG